MYTELNVKRKELKLTFAQLSEKSGIPLRTLQDVLQGRTANPRIDTMQAIEKALGINDTSIQQNNNISLKEQRLLTAFNDLIPPMQDYIIEMIEKLVAQPQNKSKHA